MRNAAALLALAGLLVTAPVAGQMAAGTRSVAMGGGGMVFATGVDAVDWNPANLGWSRGWNISLFEVGFAGLGDGLTVDELRTILGDDQPGLNVSSVVAGLPEDGFRFTGVFEGFATAFVAELFDVPQPGAPLPTLGIAVGPVAFRIRSRVFSDVVLSKPLADLVGNGFEQERLLDYAVGNTAWRAVSLTEHTVAYGTQFGGLLSVGVAGRYVKGHKLLDGRLFEPQINITSETLTIQSVSVESSGGSGYGLDLGLSFDLPLGFRASASGTNVFQRLTWDESLTAHIATFTDADFDREINPDLPFHDFFNRHSAEPIDPNGVSLAVFVAGQSLFEQSYFPQIYRGGVGWQAGGTTLEATAVKVSPRGRFTSPWDERVSLGFEQKIPLLTLRGGYGMAKDGLSTYSAGLGLRFGPVHLEVSGGKLNGGLLDWGSWEGAYLSTGLQIRGGGL